MFATVAHNSTITLLNDEPKTALNDTIIRATRTKSQLASYDLQVDAETRRKKVVKKSFQLRHPSMQISMKQSLASLVAEKAAIGCEYNTKKVLMSTYAIKNPSTATSANVMRKRLNYSTN